MTSCFGLFLFLAVVIGPSIYFVYTLFLRNTVIYQQFNSFLERFGGAVSVPKGFVTGMPYYNTTYKRRPLRISLHQSSGKQKTIYSRFHMNVTDPAFEFVITRQDLLNNIGKLLGMEDITIGDEVFDKAFIIKTNSLDRFIETFNFEIRQNLISNETGSGGTLRLSNGKLFYERVGSFHSESFNNHFSSMIELASKIAERIDGQSAKLMPTSSAVEEIPEVMAAHKQPVSAHPKWNDWPEDEQYLKRLTRDLPGGRFKKENDRCLYVTQYRKRELALEYFYSRAPRILNISLTVTQKFWLRMLTQVGEDTPDEIRVSDPFVDSRFRIHSDQKEAAKKFLETHKELNWISIFDRFEINKGRAMLTITDPKGEGFLRSAFEKTLGSALQLLQAYEEQRLAMSISQSTSPDHICPYCREDLDADKELIVICKLCHTPHHQSCLNENKQCTTWGCLATESDFA